MSYNMFKKMKLYSATPDLNVSERRALSFVVVQQGWDGWLIASELKLSSISKKTTRLTCGGKRWGGSFNSSTLIETDMRAFSPTYTMHTASFLYK
jgi:hypothetical protein